MSMKYFPISLILFMSSIATAYAEPQDMKQYIGSEQFEQMKQLAGTWRGTSKMEAEEREVTVTYRVSSAGSSVVETLFPGTAQEMVSVYHDVNGSLQMTHFCALKNQPTLGLTDARGDTIRLSYVSGSNIDPKKDAHMHALEITMENKNRIVQHWTLYRTGERAGTTKLVLSRITP